MPIYVIVAYVVFCGVPLAMGVITNLRYHRPMREIEAVQRAPRHVAEPDRDTVSASKPR